MKQLPALLAESAMMVVVLCLMVTLRA